MWTVRNIASVIWIEWRHGFLHSKAGVRQSLACGGPLFVGHLFGRSCWTCINPPLNICSAWAAEQVPHKKGLKLVWFTDFVSFQINHFYRLVFQARSQRFCTRQKVDWSLSIAMWEVLSNGRISDVVNHNSCTFSVYFVYWLTELFRQTCFRL